MRLKGGPRIKLERDRNKVASGGATSRSIISPVAWISSETYLLPLGNQSQMRVWWATSWVKEPWEGAFGQEILKNHLHFYSGMASTRFNTPGVIRRCWWPTKQNKQINKMPLKGESPVKKFRLWFLSLKLPCWLGLDPWWYLISLHVGAKAGCFKHLGWWLGYFTMA